MHRWFHVLLLLSALGTALAQTCWQRSYKREVHYEDWCPDGYEDYVDNCYGACPSGHKPYHDVCYKDDKCPPPFGDAEDSCTKPPSYSRPSYPLFEQEECERNHQDVGGCELVGPLWMPKCKAGYHGVLSECVVSCPPDYEDHVVSCFKPHVSRPSKPHQCPPNTSPESPGSDFCYAACNTSNHFGFGQVCWGKCPTTHKKCSEALCVDAANYDKVCTPDEIEYLEETYEDVDFYLHVTPGDIQLATALNVVTGYHYEMCNSVGSAFKRLIRHK